MSNCDMKIRICCADFLCQPVETGLEPLWCTVDARAGGICFNGTNGRWTKHRCRDLDCAGVVWVYLSRRTNGLVATLKKTIRSKKMPRSIRAFSLLFAIDDRLSGFRYPRSRARFRPDTTGAGDRFCFADRQSFLSTAKPNRPCATVQRWV